jgi:hypothetical protein
MSLIDLVPAPWRAAGAVLLAAALVGGAAWYRQHLVEEGRSFERQQHELADAKRARAADAALAAANAEIALNQTALDIALDGLNKLAEELHAQEKSTVALQSDLAAGRKRLSVAATCPGSHPAQADQGGAAAGLDSQPAVAAELDPQAASRVVELTGTGDSAIVRLNACITAYDAVERATSAGDVH